MPKVLVPSSRTPVVNEDDTFSREWYLYLNKLGEQLSTVDVEKTPEELNLQYLKDIIAFERITIT